MGYVSSPTKAIIGEARIKQVHLDTPEQIYESYGHLGLYDLDEIRAKQDKTGRVQTLVLGRTIRFRKPISLKRIRSIKPNFSPEGGNYVSYDELKRFREKGEYPG